LMSANEIYNAFKCLDLDTQEKRKKVLNPVDYKNNYGSEQNSYVSWTTKDTNSERDDHGCQIGEDY
jgi:hypothetical protein